MNRKKILEETREISEELGERLGYELVDLDFVKEGSQYFLRVYIHKDGGVGLDDCQKMSQALSESLDELDPISIPYYLEVSSPGLDRPLKTDKDFKRNIGNEIEVKLYEAIDGKKLYTGILNSYDEDYIFLDLNNENLIKILKNKVALIKLVLKF